LAFGLNLSAIVALPRFIEEGVVTLLAVLRIQSVDGFSNEVEVLFAGGAVFVVEPDEGSIALVQFTVIIAANFNVVLASIEGEDCFEKGVICFHDVLSFVCELL